MTSNSAIPHFLKCLQHHPAFSQAKHIVLGLAKPYALLCRQISDIAHHILKPTLFERLSLENDNVMDKLSKADLYVIFYDSDQTRSSQKPEYTDKLEPFIKFTWQKSCIIKNYGEHFKRAFACDPELIRDINSKLIKLATASATMTFKDRFGSHLDIHIEGAKWTSICGFGNPYIVPGEIATVGRLNGTVHFSGVFLSTLPFAFKYGKISPPLLRLDIQDNLIISHNCANPALHQDLALYFNYRGSNRKIEEVGIGTNPGVTELFSLNAGFEERHVGLHLGLGGAEAGSNHLDLIFAEGEIYFDNTLINQNLIKNALFKQRSAALL